MSLLLDALKKSEAQRRRGSTPTIDLTRTPSSGAPRRPGSRGLLVLLSIVVLTIVGLAAAAPWFWPQVSNWIDERDEAGQAATPVGATANTESVPEPESSTAQAVQPEPPGPAPVAGASSSRRVAAAQTSLPEPASAENGAERGGEDGDAGPATQDPEAPSRTVATSTDGASNPQESPAAGREPDPAVSMQEIRRRMQQATADASTAETQAAEPPEEPASERREASSPQANGPADNFIRPWELPQAQRAEFPELRLTVHFYAEGAPDRFVLINGERYKEGQRVGPGTRLVEIRQRGAVVEFGSYRVLIE